MRIIHCAMSGEFISRMFKYGTQEAVPIRNKLPDDAMLIHTEWLSTDLLLHMFFVSNTDGHEVPEGGDMFGVPIMDMVFERPL